MEELTGNLVMVHPKLVDDPVQRQGQIGIITSADLDNDEVYVGFGNSQLGLYSANALLVLKSHNQLYNDILTNIQKLDMPDFKTLMNITLLQEKNAVNYTREAMQLATTNARTLAYGTISLQEKLVLGKEQSLDQQYSSGLNR